MKTNTSHERFFRYFLHDAEGCIRNHTLVTVAAALAPVLVFLMHAYTGYLNSMPDWQISRSANLTISEIVLVMYLLFIPIACYGRNTARNEGSRFLMLPASHAEKFASMVLNTMVVLPVLFVLLYVGCDALMSLLFPSRYAEGTAIYQNLRYTFTDAFTVVSFPSDTEGGLTESWQLNITFLGTMFMPYMLSSTGLCGAYLFRKGNKYAKTFLTSALAFIAVMVAGILLPDSFDAHSESTIWVCIQTISTICCLTFVWFRSKNIEI